ncbi:hypothetical protein C8R44DRAFT_804596 [Mycena epipterygia]|nr:hypothetical protein C8R44DRAFT_804596 [Mycena epipterygia]
MARLDLSPSIGSSTKPSGYGQGLEGKPARRDCANGKGRRRRGMPDDGFEAVARGV